MENSERKRVAYVFTCPVWTPDGRHPSVGEKASTRRRRGNIFLGLSALSSHSLQRPLLKPWTRSGSHFALFSSDTPRKNGAKSKACTFTFDVSVLPAQITFRILGLTVTQLYMLK